MVASNSEQIKMDIHFFAKSDIGKVRTTNEDYFLNGKISDNEFLFIVADGMGGHQAGDVASKLASETFFETYKSLRKKNTSISNCLELAVRKANSVVFKKAAADIEKRGMGTTFSTVVIAGMKAFIAHVGDSRIYLIRRNKIKKITTDHSFVEKLVEEGRISVEEARDHPQKNVLYMSLGARETFSPEIMNDIILEDGDALVICSDGLSNMLVDDTILKVTMGDYPEEAADALVKLANAHGGSDNITVQVIRVGSLEMLEKTKPIRLSKPRRKLTSVIAVLVMLGILAGLWYVFFAPDGSARVESELAIKADSSPERKRTQTISEIDSSLLHDMGITAADCRFLSGHKLHVVKNDRLYVFNLGNQSLQPIELGGDNQVVPCGDKGIYLLRRTQTKALGYRLLKQGTKKALLGIQDAHSLFSKGIDSLGVPIYEIPNIQKQIMPDFINENIFIFHDLNRYYAITKWQTPENMPVPIPELAYTDKTRLFFKNVDGLMTMLYNDPESNRTAVFSLKGTIARIREFTGLQARQPLALEYLKDQALVCYYQDQCVEIRAGEQDVKLQYSFNNYRFNIIKVLVDMENGQKMIVNDANKFFSLLCDT
ncbi:MAG TPA: Stp1/IreP family PP2C-type Ser/Thr phosphatase [Patescibacteria group bacterium]|nr:Stp1/IreP family PP2C-type Ser/Thr phosphatase [Patescibacteria group bacterium]